MRSVYDSYIRAIRWASDRIEGKGIIAFVTNAGFLDSTSADGLRKCLANEFSSLYVVNLRGNQRTSGETSRREGGKIFGAGSRAPIAISILVRNPNSSEHGEIYYHDIGDYLTREQKLARLIAFRGIAGTEAARAWSPIQPDDYGDWLRQRDPLFLRFIPAIDGEKSGKQTVFTIWSRGIQTGRDAWCYNYSAQRLWSNIERASFAYNAIAEIKKPGVKDPTKFSWCDKTRLAAGRGKLYTPSLSNMRKAIYRPFTPSWLYTDSFLSWSAYRMPSIFPTCDTENRIICIRARWVEDGFGVLMVDRPIDVQADGGIQCLPLRSFDDARSGTTDLPGLAGGEVVDGPESHPAISDAGLAHFRSAYLD